MNVPIIPIPTFTFQSGDIQIFSTHNNSPALGLFTFQSGDIQIASRYAHYAFNLRFTFQSGDIQIKQVHTGDIFLILNHLHSNLVIFKFF